MWHWPVSVLTSETTWTLPSSRPDQAGHPPVGLHPEGATDPGLTKDFTDLVVVPPRVVHVYMTGRDEGLGFYKRQHGRVLHSPGDSSSMYDVWTVLIIMWLMVLTGLDGNHSFAKSVCMECIRVHRIMADWRNNNIVSTGLELSREDALCRFYHTFGIKLSYHLMPVSFSILNVRFTNMTVKPK